MRINVAQQFKASIGTVRAYQIDDTADFAGRNSPVQGSIRLIRTNRGILAKGVLDTEVEVNCSRCLSPFLYPVSLSIEEEYFPVIDVVSGTPLALPDEPGCFTIDEHHILDLNEAMRQYALLAIPMKPLCRQDCAGLCPRCGQNLGQGPCACPPQKKDSRWAKLRELAPAGDE
ncbi:DUF177 domain-containing protein [Chloroflexota bacterium]